VVGLLGPAAPAPAQTKNPDREAYFGETHVHTSWSLDAWLIGNRITDPGDAYKYFKGEPIKHPLGFEVKIASVVSPLANPKPGRKGSSDEAQEADPSR
jgi:hypothetical protein